MAMDLAELNCLQYPLTGPTSCNDRIEAANECRTDFAVPSDGSNLRQPICLFLQQYHQPLAVPSDGSNLMQRLIATIDKLQRKRLQYPLTGRTSCNQTYGSAFTPASALAVPSDGSNLMQLVVGICLIRRCSTCSTLRRVEPHATSRQTHVTGN